MLKKLTALSLTLSIIFTCIPAIFGISALAADSVLLDDNFDDGASSVVSSTTAITADYIDITTLTDAAGGNSSGKVLKLSKAANTSASGGYAYFTIPETSDNLTLSYKALIGDGSGSLAIGAVNSSGEWFKSGMYSKFGRLSGDTYTQKIYTNSFDSQTGSAPDNAIADLIYNKWYDVKVEMNVAQKTYYITLDGIKTGPYNFRDSTESSFTTIDSVYLWFVSTTAARTLYLDDLKVTRSVSLTPGVFDSEFTDKPVLASENFNGYTAGAAYTNAGSVWDKSNTYTSMTVVTDTEKGKVLKVASGQDSGGFTYCKFDYTLPAATSNSILVSFDMKASKGSKKIGLYAHGTSATELSGANGANCITSVLTFNGDTGIITNSADFTDYTAGAMDYQTASENVFTEIEYNKWVNIKILIDTAQKKLHFYYEDDYVGSSDFRKTDVKDITGLYVGFDGRSNYTADTYMDNLSYVDLAKQTSTLYNMKEVNYWGFDNASELDDFAVTKTVGSSELADGAFKITSSSNKNAESKEYTATFAKDITGAAKLSFRYMVDGKGQLNMHLQPSTLQSFHIKNAGVTLYSPTSTAISSSSLNNGAGTGTGWHTCDVLLNLAKKQCRVVLDGYILPDTYPFRNSSSKFGSMVFSVYGNGTDDTSVYIDDISVSEDITYYPAPAITSSRCNIDSKNYIISLAESETVAVSDMGTLISGADNYTISVSDNDSNGYITNNDTVTLTSLTDPAEFTYTINVQSDIDVSIESLLVTGTDNADDDFSTASRVTKAGAAEINVRVTNNTSDTMTPYIAAAAYDDDGTLTSVGISDSGSIAAYGTTDYELNLTVPSGVDSGALKIFVWESASSMKPLLKFPVEYSIETNDFAMDNCFSNGMVLQRGTSINVFGSAPEGAKVTAALGDSNTAAAYVAKGSNEFLVQLASEDASLTGKTLTVTAEAADGSIIGTKTITDVLVGDVYLGTGQSNMQYTSNALISNSTLTQEVYDAEVGDLENVWCFNVSNTTLAKRVDSPGSISETWKDLSVKSNAMNASATMVNMAKQIRSLTGDSSVPIGLITCSKGATTINKWVSKTTICESYAFDGTTEESDYVNNVADKYDVEPTQLYYTMSRSIMPYTVKAVVWYQGEGDSGKARYDLFVDALINDYRTGFCNKNLPYLIVQLPGYVSSTNWTNLQLAQWNVQKLSDNVYTVVTNDSGQSDNIHPASKAIVGERLARVILAKLGGYETMPHLSPEVNKWTSNSDGSVTLTFNNVNDGIHGGLELYGSSELTENCFEIKGSDGTWYAADANISGDTVILTSSSVTSTAAGVRYAHGGKVIKGLYTTKNGEKLPLAPFNTDYIPNTK